MSEYSRPYTIAFLGSSLAEAETCEIQYTSNDKPVRTLQKGLSGFSNGAEECTVSFRNAIPLRGFEQDFADFTMKHRTVQFTVREANVISTFEGRIMTTSSSSSVDSPNNLNVQFMGKQLSRLTL